jgi:hypothetical protein
MKINLTSQTHKPALGYAFVFGFLFLMAFIQPAPKMPYKKAGLTEQEAALHLLNRFTFGPKPGQVEEVVKQGLENWFWNNCNPQKTTKKSVLSFLVTRH